MIARSCFFHTRIMAGFVTTLAALVLTGVSAKAEDVYRFYFGTTHAHSIYSDGKNCVPADHFRLAKANGYDFYAVTDHALKKYAGYTPEHYEDTKHQADLFTDSNFVGIAGFEYSENDGPGGKGHLTALNTESTLDATGQSATLPIFYDWLTKQKTTVAASFNHAGPASYNKFDYLTPARSEAVSMFEVINSGRLCYPGFLAALEKGWRVAPMAGQDGHGLGRITTHFYRTGVLATSLTRENLMQAMRARRIYCTWDKDLRVTFRANGQMMGSVLKKPKQLVLYINAIDPDTNDPNDKITRMEIVGDNGALVAAKDFSGHAVTWIHKVNPAYKYLFVKIYAADKTDGPTAYSAPVWINKD